jgi:hypothetical protein
MKIKRVYILLMLQTICSVAQSEVGRQAVDAVSKRASAGDVHGLIEFLPDLERLWKQDPVSYVEAVKVGVQALIKSGEVDAKNAVIAALPNLIDKTCPSDTASATFYIRGKYATICSYFSFNEVRTDKDRLLMVASFLGEIRTLRIPGYQNQGTNLPGREILENAGVRKAADLPTQSQKDAFAEAVSKNEDDKKMNELQTALFSADSGLESLLITYAKDFLVKIPDDRAFYQEIAKRAKLTEEEIKMLYAPR